MTDILGFSVELQVKEILISPLDEDARSIVAVDSSETAASSCPLVSFDEIRTLLAEPLLECLNRISVEESPFVVGSVKYKKINC